MSVILQTIGLRMKNKDWNLQTKICLGLFRSSLLAKEIWLHFLRKFDPRFRLGPVKLCYKSFHNLNNESLWLGFCLTKPSVTPLCIPWYTTMSQSSEELWICVIYHTMRNRTWWASIFCTGDLPRTGSSFRSRLHDGFDAWDFNVSHSGPFLLSHFLFVLILCVVANGLKSTESWGGGGVSVDVKHVSPFNLLEKPHRGVSLIILDHSPVGLSDFDIVSWVLENASCSIGAFTWVL